MTDDFDAADGITAGTVGEPGQRVFMLQVREGGRRLTAKIEKTQAAQLAEHLTRILADRPTEPPAPPTAFEAVEPDWAVGSIGLSYDHAAGTVLLALDAFDPDDPEPPSARITVTAPQVASLVTQIEHLVAGGRPPCPLCGYPLDPSGHICPKTNGHRPPKL